ncbi:MAG: response regulator transcription factor [Nocardiopsaceae bacterium]|nr:response regulator transcription factor [Nocardiopsaceae bacterium]
MILTLVAESVALFRAGLLALLAEQSNIKVIAELDRADLIIPTALASQPRVAMIDEKITGTSFATIRALTEKVPNCRSMVMATVCNPSRLREAIAAGADGFVAKEAAPDKIIEAVRRVASGQKALDPDLAFSALNAPASPLTPREIDVLRLAAAGAPAMEIASELYLSVGTVRNYISRAIGKTGARTRVDAIRIAEGAGWL